MGTCLSKKKGSSSTTSPLAITKSASSTAQAEPELKNPENVVTVSKPKVEKNKLEVKLKKENNNNNKTVQGQEKHEPLVEEDDEDEGQVKKEILIIKHRKSHDAPQPEAAATIEAAESNMGVGVGVRTSSCTKEEVDAILIHCGRLSGNSSGKTASSSASASRRRRYSGSKRSYDFDHCENDTISNDEDHKKSNANGISDLCEDDGVANGEKSHRQHRPQHRRSPRPSPEGRRRRTPSREREQQQNCSSSSRERRVSRSPGRRSSESTKPSNASNNSNNNSTGSRPGKMVSVPASVSSLVMDKSNNAVSVGVGGGGGESVTAAGIKRIIVKRNVGAASPRSQSPARANGNAANAKVLLSENQHQQQNSSLSRNNSRKAEQSPCRRNPMSEVDPNSLAYPQSTASNSSSRVQNRPKKELETEANQQKHNAINKVALDKDVSANCKTKLQQEEDVKVQPTMADNFVVKTLVPPGVDSLKPETLTRSRSSRRSRDLDHNPEPLLVPPQSYTSLLLEDIQNFHQKNTPSVSLPACVTKACSILEAVADLNSNTAEDKKSPPTYQSYRNECNVPLSAIHCGKRVTDTKDPFVESEVVVNDDVMEPSFHRYVTVNRGGSLGGVDMEDQESSGSNSFTFSSGQQHWGISSADSKDCWTSRLNHSREEAQKSPLGMEGSVSSEAASDVDGARKKLNSKRRECDHQHGSGIGRGSLGPDKGLLHTIPVVTNPHRSDK